MQEGNSIDPVDLGILPKRGQSQAHFESRLETTRLTSEHLKAYFSKSASKESIVGEKELAEALDVFENHSGLRPCWACALYSSQGLGFLHLGALMELVQEDQEAIKNSFIQLHPRFQKRPAWWGYQRKDILAHELVHLIRHELDDEKYEEFMAYSFEEKRWRRKLGPFFSTPQSAIAFMGALSLLTISLSSLCLGPELAGPSTSELFFTGGALGVSLSLIGLLALLGDFLTKSWRWAKFYQKGISLIQCPKAFFQFALIVCSSDVEKLSKLPIDRWAFYLSQLPPSPYRQALEKRLHRQKGSIT